MATPVSMTSPTPYWSSSSMNSPVRKSRTIVWAPNARAMPTTPAPAISGASSIPSSPRAVSSAIVHTTALTTLRSTTPIVCARWMRRTLGISSELSSSASPVRRRRVSILDSVSPVSSRRTMRLMTWCPSRTTT